MHMWKGLSVCVSVCFCLSVRLLDGSLWNFMQTFMDPRGQGQTTMKFLTCIRMNCHNFSDPNWWHWSLFSVNCLQHLLEISIWKSLSLMPSIPLPPSLSFSGRSGGNWSDCCSWSSLRLLTSQPHHKQVVVWPSSVLFIVQWKPCCISRWCMTDQTSIRF